MTSMPSLFTPNLQLPSDSNTYAAAAQSIPMFQPTSTSSQSLPAALLQIQQLQLAQQQQHQQQQHVGYFPNMFNMGIQQNQQQQLPTAIMSNIAPNMCALQGQQNVFTPFNHMQNQSSVTAPQLIQSQSQQQQLQFNQQLQYLLLTSAAANNHNIGNANIPINNHHLFLPQINSQPGSFNFPSMHTAAVAPTVQINPHAQIKEEDNQIQIHQMHDNHMDDDQYTADEAEQNHHQQLSQANQTGSSQKQLSADERSRAPTLKVPTPGTNQIKKQSFLSSSIQQYQQQKQHELQLLLEPQQQSFTQKPQIQSTTGSSSARAIVEFSIPQTILPTINASAQPSVPQTAAELNQYKRMLGINVRDKSTLAPFLEQWNSQDEAEKIIEISHQLLTNCASAQTAAFDHAFKVEYIEQEQKCNYVNKFINSKGLIVKDDKLGRIKIENKISRFHNLSRLLMYTILTAFNKNNLSMMNLDALRQEAILKMIQKLKLSARKKTPKGLIKTDFFNHTHYNVLFLTINEHNFEAVSKNPKDVATHAKVFGFDLSKPFEEIQNDIRYSNVIKKLAYHIMLASYNRSKEDKSDILNGSSNSTFREQYIDRAMLGITKLNEGKLIQRF